MSNPYEDFDNAVRGLRDAIWANRRFLALYVLVIWSCFVLAMFVCAIR